MVPFAVFIEKFTFTLNSSPTLMEVWVDDKVKPAAKADFGKINSRDKTTINATSFATLLNHWASGIYCQIIIACALVNLETEVEDFSP